MNPEEAQSDLTPLSKEDFGPITPLTTDDLMALGQDLIQALFEERSLATRIRNGTIIDPMDEQNINLATGRATILRRILTMSGQEKVVGDITAKISTLLPDNDF